MAFLVLGIVLLVSEVAGIGPVAAVGLVVGAGAVCTGRGLVGDRRLAAG